MRYPCGCERIIHLDGYVDEIYCPRHKPILMHNLEKIEWMGGNHDEPGRSSG